MKWGKHYLLINVKKRFSFLPLLVFPLNRVQIAIANDFVFTHFLSCVLNSTVTDAMRELTMFMYKKKCSFAFIFYVTWKSFKSLEAILFLALSKQWMEKRSELRLVWLGWHCDWNKYIVELTSSWLWLCKLLNFTYK